MELGQRPRRRRDRFHWPLLPRRRVHGAASARGAALANWPHTVQVQMPGSTSQCRRAWEGCKWRPPMSGVAAGAVAGGAEKRPRQVERSQARRAVTAGRSPHVAQYRRELRPGWSASECEVEERREGRREGGGRRGRGGGRRAEGSSSRQRRRMAAPLATTAWEMRSIDVTASMWSGAN